MPFWKQEHLIFSCLIFALGAFKSTIHYLEASPHLHLTLLVPWSQIFHLKDTEKYISVTYEHPVQGTVGCYNKCKTSHSQEFTTTSNHLIIDSKHANIMWSHCEFLPFFQEMITFLVAEFSIQSIVYAYIEANREQ